MSYWIYIIVDDYWDMIKDKNILTSLFSAEVKKGDQVLIYHKSKKDKVDRIDILLSDLYSKPISYINNISDVLPQGISFFSSHSSLECFLGLSTKAMNWQFLTGGWGLRLS